MNKILFCDEMVDGFAKRGDETAIICRDICESYFTLHKRIEKWRNILCDNEIHSGDVVTLSGNYGIDQIALLFALILNRNVVSPISRTAYESSSSYVDVVNASHICIFDKDGSYLICRNRHQSKNTHPLLSCLQRNKIPGLILFSSGSTGTPKAILLDIEKLLQKFRQQRPAMRTLMFLLLDHIGGLNTLFAVLSQGGLVLTPASRQARDVAAAIAKYRIELLPTTPTFLKMLLISDAYRHYNLSSLKIVTYGTEPMPQSTLSAIAAALPQATIKQTYGLSELGILSTQSKSSDSTLVRIGGKGFEYKIVNQTLWIRSASAMLGYLNYDDPFLDDGWYDTGDLVEVEGEYLRILGRKSELINVGGEKVHPNEVENVLLSDPNVAEAIVLSKNNPVTGNVVVATVRLAKEENWNNVTQRLSMICREKLEPYKVPMLFTQTSEALYNERFKKIRAKGAL